MTEKELRSKIVEIGKDYLGCKESDGSHKKIIDIYNAHKPLARNYKVTYTDAWCATYCSAMAIKAGFTEIIPLECSCNALIEKAKAMGIWVENDSYVPKAGDFILYDWDDSGSGDDKGGSEHIGMVVSVSGSTTKVIEGNKSDAVGYRNIAVNGKYIRGYICPKYSKLATKEPAKEESNSGSSSAGSSLKFSVGDKVKFTGTVHYTSSSKSATGHACKAGTAKVTAVNKGSAHPYHLVAVTGKGSTVYGWVNEDKVKAISSGSKSTPKVGDKITVTGYYYDNGNGGTKKKVTKKTMYVTELVSSKTYKYYIGVSPTKGGARWGWIALSSIV